MTQVIGRILFALICLGLGGYWLVAGGAVWVGLVLLAAGVLTLFVGIEWR